MYYKLRTGNTLNIPVADYYAESEEEMNKFENVAPGSVCMILTEQGLTLKMYHSSGKWIAI
jgi:hypothetical protein